MIAKEVLKTLLPDSARRWLRRQPLRAERWVYPWRGARGGNPLLRPTPISAGWGGHRGQIVDRYYIENFLEVHKDDVHGHVLDFGDDTYARRFGGPKVSRVDVLHLAPGNPRATLVADLSDGAGIPSDTYDCVICTQVLLFVYNLHAAVRTLYRILRPGGTILVTAPGIQKISRGDMETCGDYWRFTSLALRRLFEEVFPKDHVEVVTYGNVLAAVAFLHGLAVEDLRRGDLDYHDPDYEVAISLRAVKPPAG